MSSVKIALTGAHGTGKTTLATAFAERFRSTTSVTLLDEVPRLIIDEVGDPSFFRRGHNTFQRQCLILARQLESEGVASCDSASRLMVCDRTLVDHWAYSEVLFPDSAASSEALAWRSLVFRWARTYDLIVRLPPEVPPADDGVREDDPSFQREIDAKLLSLYSAAGVSVPTIGGSVAERLALLSRLASPLIHSTEE